MEGVAKPAHEEEAAERAETTAVQAGTRKHKHTQTHAKEGPFF